MIFLFVILTLFVAVASMSLIVVNNLIYFKVCLQTLFYTLHYKIFWVCRILIWYLFIIHCFKFDLHFYWYWKYRFVLITFRQYFFINFTTKLSDLYIRLYLCYSIKYSLFDRGFFCIFYLSTVICCHYI